MASARPALQGSGSKQETPDDQSCFVIQSETEEEAGAGGRELLHNQASKLSGRFGLLAKA